MPWKECSVMDERLQFVARRLRTMKALRNAPTLVKAQHSAGRAHCRSAYECGSRRQSAWLGVWFLPRLSATVVTSRISVRARCVTWKRTAVADTNGCTCWIQRPRNTLSSSRKEWQLRLFVRSRVGAKSRTGWIPEMSRNGSVPSFS